MIRFKVLFIAAITSIQMLFSGALPNEVKTAEPPKLENTSFKGKALDNNNRKIVELSNNNNLKNLSSLLRGMDIIELGNGRYIIIGGSLNSNQLEKKLSRLKGVKKVENPRTIKIVDPVEKNAPLQNNPEQVDKSIESVNDPGYKYEWYIGTTMADKAWSLVKQQREIKVAVLDTGIDYNHPDLKNRILTDLGYNFLNGTTDASDDNGHGTHVSGIIAAEANNNQGITGMAGSLDVKIIPIKVLNAKGEGESDVIAKGIRLAADEGADIINMSFGTPENDTDIDNAIQYAVSKGSFLVAAAGNDARDCDSYTPAGDKGVFTVSAIGSNLKRAYFSNYGTAVQVAAPGVSILSTIPGGKYQSWNGTSMAAPIVSGVAAILKAEDPALTPDNIASMLDTTAQNSTGQAKNSYTGYGIVNAYNAIKKLEGIK